MPAEASRAPKERYMASASVGFLARIKAGRLPWRVCAQSVNWLTSRISPPMSVMERFILSFWSAKMRSFATFAATVSMSRCVSRSSMPSKMR